MKLHPLLLCAVLAVSACSTPPPADLADDRTYPYVNAMPADDSFVERYSVNIHTASPLERYHFRMAIPKGWLPMDIVIDEEPTPSAFAELGVFRQPGAWQNDSKAAPAAEITISVVNMEGDERSAEQWVKDIVLRNAPDAETLESLMVKTSEGDALDVLLRYKDKKGSVMNRMAAFREGDRLYIISGSDTINGYRDTAEAMYVAIATFELTASPDINPFVKGAPAASGSLIQ